MTLARFTFIKAARHADVVDQALRGFLDVIPDEQVDVFDMPGAFELPLLARDLAKTDATLRLPRRLWSWTAASIGMTSWLRPWLMA